MKFMYDNRTRTYGCWPKDHKEKEVSLEELLKIIEQAEDYGLYLLIDRIDKNGTFHIVKYDGDY